MNTLLAIIAAYLVGSIPFAFLLARRRGIGLRHAGSRNVGASNVLRTSGIAPAVVAATLDGLKGALAVFVAEGITTGPGAPVAAGLASMVGHIYPVWLRFKGGKGVATAAGAFSVLAPIALAAASVVFAVVVVLTRFVSIGSMSGALALTIVTVVTDSSPLVTAGAALATALIVYCHRGNLTRLVVGTERRVGGV